MNLDLTTLAPLIGAILPFIITLVPGLRNIFAALPRSFFEAIVSVKGGSITWKEPVSSEVLKAEIAGLVAKGAATPSDPNHELLQAKKQELVQAIGDGTLIEKIKPFLPIIIIGIVVFVIMNKGGAGGCQKPAPKVVPTPAAETTDLR